MIATQLVEVMLSESVQVICICLLLFFPPICTALLQEETGRILSSLAGIRLEAASVCGLVLRFADMSLQEIYQDLLAHFVWLAARTIGLLGIVADV